jgi:hypothetical protein
MLIQGIEMNPTQDTWGFLGLFAPKSLLLGAFASWQDLLDEEAGYVHWPSLEWYSSYGNMPIETLLAQGSNQLKLEWMPSIIFFH